MATGGARIAAGGYPSLLLKSDGTLWLAGSNGSGQIGLSNGVRDVAWFQQLIVRS